MGLLTVTAAQNHAYDKGLDLVMIAAQADPPVCKIIDYGKFRFERDKKEKEAKKKQQIMDIKEIRLSCAIDTNDFKTKVNHARRFLTGGDKVKVIVSMWAESCSRDSVRHAPISAVRIRLRALTDASCRYSSRLTASERVLPHSRRARVKSPQRLPQQLLLRIRARKSNSSVPRNIKDHTDQKSVCPGRPALPDKSGKFSSLKGALSWERLRHTAQLLRDSALPRAVSLR